MSCDDWENNDSWGLFGRKIYALIVQPMAQLASGCGALVIDDYLLLISHLLFIYYFLLISNHICDTLYIKIHYGQRQGQSRVKVIAFCIAVLSFRHDFA